jgi:hypothetical protein
MPVAPQNLLRALRDEFTPVRDTTGRLLGCVPRVPDSAEALRGSNGALYELRIAAQVCVCVSLDDPLQHPSALDGFIPLDDANLDLAVPVPRGDDPDLAQGV